MKRPFLLMFILLIANIFFALNFSYKIALVVIFLTTVILVLIIDYKVIIVSVFAIGLSFFVLYTINNEATKYQGDVIVSGHVSEYGINSEDSFILNSDYIIDHNNQEKFKHKILIKYSEDYSNLIGKKIIVKMSLDLPFQNTNPNLFNYRNYLRSLGIDYIATINQSNILSVSDMKFSIDQTIYKFRQELSKHFERVYSGKTLAFIKGFIYGDKSEFTMDQLNAFYNVGLGHILVVSGLHFGIMFLILQWLLTQLKFKQIHKLLIINMILLMFLAITGFKVSSIRAFFMIILLESIYFIDHRLDLLNFLSFLSILIMLVNPFSIYSVSFLLSFGAIFSIAFFYNKINDKLPSFISIVLSVQIIIGLINIHIFNQINFATLIINIPMNIVVVALYALILINMILHPVHVLTILITEMINIIFKIVDFLDGQSFLRFILPSFSKVNSIFILALLLTLVLIYEREKISGKALIYVFLSGIILLSSLPFFNKSVEIFFYDVKSGDSIFISTPRKNKVLIDTGRDDSYNLIGDILLKNATKDIDLLFLTHNHNDHTGGLENLLKKHSVKYLFVPKYSDFIEDLTIYQEHLENTKIISLESGDQIIYDDIVFNVMNPMKSSLNENNQSLVLDMNYREYNVLFTGDVEKEIEFELINDLESNYDLLKVPHHGYMDNSYRLNNI